MSKHEKREQSTFEIDDVYKILGPKFLDELWVDVLSELKEKQNYKIMKEMVTSLIKDKINGYEIKPKDGAAPLPRRIVVSEISIMAYTVDSVVTQVMRKEIEAVFASQIVDALEEHGIKKLTSQFNPMLENIESFLSGPSSNKKRKSYHKIKTSPRRGRPPILPRKSLSVEIGNGSANTSKKATPGQKRGRPPKQTFIAVKQKDDYFDGNQSTGSISSVHTDDLSSYDDNISVYSEDSDHPQGTRKRKVSLSKANSLVKEGKLPSIYTDTKNNKKVKDAVLKGSKVLPKRIRKPNSKYTDYYSIDYYKPPSYKKKRSSDTSDDESDVEFEEKQITKEVKEINSVARIPVSSPSKRLEGKVFLLKKQLSSGSASKENMTAFPVNKVSKRSSNYSSSSEKSFTELESSPSKAGTTTQRYTASDLYKPRFSFVRP